MKNKYSDLSQIQKEKYLSICGYEYVPGSLKGELPTMLAYQKDCWKSPWLFKFKFDKIKGCLYCFLGHRMTNDRTYGWDYEGNELSSEIVNMVFPIYPTIRIIEKP